VANDVESVVKTTPLWKEGSRFIRVTCRWHQQINTRNDGASPRKETEMITQASRSNDCGVFTLLSSRAYLRYLDSVKAWDEVKRGSISSASSIHVIVSPNGTAESLGQSGRKHIERAFRHGRVDQNDSTARFKITLPCTIQ
jgi:hypothetical protein